MADKKEATGLVGGGESIYMDITPSGFEIADMDSIDYRPKKCIEHKKLLLKIDLRNGRMICNSCEKDDSDQIVDLEEYCQD
jgi:hypothetical protein